MGFRNVSLTRNFCCNVNEFFFFYKLESQSLMVISNLKRALIILIKQWDKFAKVGDFFYPKVNKFAFLSQEKWELDESAGSS